jgi:HSP20 family protein
MDLLENVEANTVTAIFELPGLGKEEIVLTVQNGHLTISGEVREAKPSTQNEEYIIHERKSGKFSRTLKLPQGVQVCLFYIFDHAIKHFPQEEDIKAKTLSGLLTVTFPKFNADRAPKAISIV